METPLHYWGICEQLESRTRGQRDGSVVQSIHRYCRGLGLSSQHSHGSSKHSVTPVPEDLTLLSGLGDQV